MNNHNAIEILSNHNVLGFYAMSANGETKYYSVDEIAEMNDAVEVMPSFADSEVDPT